MGSNKNKGTVASKECIQGVVASGPLKICSSMKAIGTLAKTVKIHFFRALEISHRLVTNQGVFIQEKWQNLKKPGRLVTF